MQDSLSFITAFSGGLLSFLSPCVLPLIPGYLSFVTGLTSAELSDKDRSLSAVLIPSLLFVAGFSVVFVAMGASASLLGQWLIQYREPVRIVGGVAVILFGVMLLGIIKIPGLYREARFNLASTRRFGNAAAPVLGMAFAAGWTPCVGPILATILGIAGSTGDAAQGALLLLVYSAGLAVPFLLMAVLFGRVRPLTSWLVRRSRVISVVAGVLMIGTGVLILTNKLAMLAGMLAGLLPSLG